MCGHYSVQPLEIRCAENRYVKALHEKDLNFSELWSFEFCQKNSHFFEKLALFRYGPVRHLFRPTDAIYTENDAYLWHWWNQQQKQDGSSEHDTTKPVRKLILKVD